MNGQQHGAARVSVLMTAYEREDYFTEAIKRVLASEFAHSDLVVAGDCASDWTLDAAGNDARVRTERREHNLVNHLKKAKLRAEISEPVASVSRTNSPAGRST